MSLEMAGRKKRDTGLQIRASDAAPAFRSARRGVLQREMQEHRITSVRNTVCIVETALSTVRYRQ